ncbi:sulfatase-like hydrolase/transferase [Nocardia sp. 2YAB30]|uniref:sulfatase-like hydrolase/transferase n=1 Tax=unclassified Nocardia TaxID=2637762 RepID=UPI003F999F1D
MSINRRRFFARGAAAATAATAMPGATGTGKARADVDPDKPNILVVLVDEMRAPMWFPDQEALDGILPNIARIRRAAVSFEQHYTAANDCTPSRGVLLTGLYSHQTGCMMTSQSTLSPLFPTWGSMIREYGYETVWWGKWHLGHDSDTDPGSLANYGFAGGTYPSPNGAPGQGLQMDPTIVDQFLAWLDAEAGRGPWCCTVSLVNPHDIQWWPRWTRRLQAQLDIPRWMNDLPANYETLEQLAEKPRLQMALVEASAVAFGMAPYGTPGAEQQWIDMRNLYLWLQQQVDIQIGRVLDGLYQRLDVAANTVIVFTSDHGDYAGSHGLHGKGGAAYDEAIRVPLYVHDPRGLLSPTSSTRTRGQLTSSVDITPLLLTIATGGSAWRGDARYTHLADRLDIAALCRDRGTPGRPWIVHATDEPTIEEAAVLFNQNAPAHVAAVRTADAKYVSYSHFVNGRIEIDPAQQQEYELYDYAASGGQLELDNQAARNGELSAHMEPLLQQAIVELNQPLPPYLRQAQEQGWADYLAQEHNILAIAQHALGELQNVLPK